MKKISLITITRNNADGLRRTLASVSAQRYGALQHIVVDGMSTDDTAAVLADVKDTQVVKAEPRGVYNAINVGLHAADGDIVGLLHAGDVFSSDYVLQRIADTFSGATAPDFVFGDVHFVDSQGRMTRYYSGENFTADSVRYGMAPPHPSLYLTAGAALRAGDYRDDFALSGDFEMFVRLTRGGYSWRYLPLDMVTMDSGGLSSKWRHRLITHNVERMRALRLNGVKCSPLLFAVNYYYVLKSFICKKR